MANSTTPPDDARKALSADAAALAELDILARDLGLGG